MTSTGAPVNVCSGQFIAMPSPQCDHATVVDAGNIGPQFVDKNVGKLDGRILTQAQVFEKWDTRLRQDEQVDSKTTRVHAKVMLEEGNLETIVDKAADPKGPTFRFLNYYYNEVQARQSYSRDDYIMRESRGGRYPMNNQQFAARYDATRPQSASDPRLASAGFKLYEAKGKVLAHILTREGADKHFPGAQFYGKCK